MAVKTPHQAKVVSLAAARERTPKHPRSRPEPHATSANVWKCGQCDEITEELLQFHPVFRHLAE